MSEIIGILNAEDSINAILTPEDGMIVTLGYCGEQGPKGDKGDPGEDGSIVSVSATGTATDTVQYITIDGVEKKLAGGSGSSDRFVATYGQTTFSEIANAIDANKTIDLNYGGSIIHSNEVHKSPIRISFVCFPSLAFAPGRVIYYLTINSNSNWTQYTTEFQPKLTAGNGITITENVISANYYDGIFYRAYYGVSTFNDIASHWDSGHIIVMLMQNESYSGNRRIYFANSRGSRPSSQPLERIIFYPDGGGIGIYVDENNNWGEEPY